MSSEIGVLPIPEERIVKKWRLQPGKMFLIDLEQGRIIDDVELKQSLSQARPTAPGSRRRATSSTTCRPRAESRPPQASLLDTQQAFGYSQEDIKFILQPMATAAEEATGSMGNDSALPVLSDRNKPLYGYFKQLFAQVTNPPIDPIREEIVMSLTSFIGPKPNLLGIDETDPMLRLEVHHPVLSGGNLAKLVNIDKLTGGHFRALVLDMTYPAGQGAAGMEKALAKLRADAEKAVGKYNVLILSDRAVSRDRVAIPALLVCSGVHHHLVRHGLRTSTPVWWWTPARRAKFTISPCSPATAPRLVCPWLVFETLTDMAPALKVEAKEARKRFIKAINKGLLKVMSKMGISTYQSYCGAQIFEAIGLNSAFVGEYFSGTVQQRAGHRPGRGGGRKNSRMHRAAFGADPGARQRAGGRGRVRLAHARRGAHVDAGIHRQAAARHAHRQGRDLQGIRQAHQRSDEGAT
jgi:glutamate synthase (NADPH/NADH) large chain